MKEFEWDRCEKPRRMLAFLAANCQPSPRKLRLFACACVRRGADLSHWPEWRELMDVAERYAEQLVQLEEVESLCLPQAYCAAARLPDCGDREDALVAELAMSATRLALHRDALQSALGASDYSIKTDIADGYPASTTELGQCDLLRDIFGNPFATLEIDSHLLTWNDAAIPNLAKSIYDARDAVGGQLGATRMRILADALEQAGSASSALVNHCRLLRPHVRGCWVLDLLLGKA